MPSFSQRRLVENLDLDAELAQRLAAAGEFLGIEHIRRLVDEIAGEMTPSTVAVTASLSEALGATRLPMLSAISPAFSSSGSFLVL